MTNKIQHAVIANIVYKYALRPFNCFILPIRQDRSKKVKEILSVRPTAGDRAGGAETYCKISIKVHMLIHMSNPPAISNFAGLFTGRAATGFNELLTMPMFVEGKGLVRKATPDLLMRELQLEIVETIPRKRHSIGEKAKKAVEQFLLERGASDFFIVLSTLKSGPSGGFRHYVSVSLNPHAEAPALTDLQKLLEALPQTSLEAAPHR